MYYVATPRFDPPGGARQIFKVAACVNAGRAIFPSV